MSKLRSRRGETLVEVMVSLLIVILIISMLPMALETAARINASVKKMETICAHTMNPAAQTSVNVTLYGSNDIALGTFSVQGYQENGFTYYIGQ